ncbi:helix-turn-helix domain-containing protein, partial [Escherichia coli]
MSSIYSKEYQLVIKLLRSTRIAKGLTQAQLAKELGKPQSFIAKV